MEARFYNTINVKGDLLNQYKADNKKENKLILRIFELNKAESFTPHEIQSMLEAVTGRFVLIGNVRRAITCLQKANKLIKSETAYAPGRYSKKNHTWTLVA